MRSNTRSDGFSHCREIVDAFDDNLSMVVDFGVYGCIKSHAGPGDI